MNVCLQTTHWMLIALAFCSRCGRTLSEGSRSSKGKETHGLELTGRTSGVGLCIARARHFGFSSLEVARRGGRRRRWKGGAAEGGDGEVVSRQLHWNGRAKSTYVSHSVLAESRVLLSVVERASSKRQKSGRGTRGGVSTWPLGDSKGETTTPKLSQRRRRRQLNDDNVAPL